MASASASSATPTTIARRFRLAGEGGSAMARALISGDGPLAALRHGGERPCAGQGDETRHHPGEGLEYGVAAHVLHHAHGANPAGDEEEDDTRDDGEELKTNSHALVLHESGRTEEGDEGDPSRSDRVLTLVAVHPGAVLAAVTGGEDRRDPKGEEEAQGCWGDGERQILLRHGFVPLFFNGRICWRGWTYIVKGTLT